jgi:uncharacterized protein YoxC
MRNTCTLAMLVLALAVGACGESSADKAQSKVCNARDDMAKQVDQLTGMTAATLTTDAVTQSLDALKNDLNDITQAQSDLTGSRRQAVEAASKAFATQVKEIAGNVGSSLSASDAKAALTTSLQQLGASYQKTFAPMNCD